MDSLTNWVKSLNSEILLKLKCTFWLIPLWIRLLDKLPKVEELPVILQLSSSDIPPDCQKWRSSHFYVTAREKNFALRKTFCHGRQFWFCCQCCPSNKSIILSSCVFKDCAFNHNSTKVYLRHKRNMCLKFNFVTREKQIDMILTLEQKR